MGHGGFKNLTRRTTCDKKTLHDKEFNIAKNPKHDGYQRVLSSMACKYFVKKSALLADKSDSGSGIKNANISNKVLAKELHKPIIRKSFFKKNYTHLL